MGECDPTYPKATKARMILSTLHPWLKEIINTRVAEPSQHTQTAATPIRVVGLFGTPLLKGQ